MDQMPCLEAVSVERHAVLMVDWRDGGRSRVDLTGWLARPNPALNALSEPDVFARAAIGGHGGMVTWDAGEGDLAIDAYHLRLIADEQAPFAADDAVSWQVGTGGSDAEVADRTRAKPIT